jgi:Raf kinase inhibitor-like YbhB/YbcL family protein
MNFIPLLLLVLAIKPSALSITSTAFNANSSIPSKYTCEGYNINPPLSIGNIPAAAKSLVLIVDDPDAPKGTFDHWVTWNISPGTKSIREDSAPGVQGTNGTGKTGYLGPCPPTGTHHYHFKVYALDTMLDAKPGSDKKTIETAIQGHILAQGELIGLYKKVK